MLVKMILRMGWLRNPSLARLAGLLGGTVGGRGQGESDVRQDTAGPEHSAGSSWRRDGGKRPNVAAPAAVPAEIIGAGRARTQIRRPVQVDDRAAGPLGFGRGQVEHGGRDLLGPRDPAERALGPDFGAVRA